MQYTDSIIRKPTIAVAIVGFFCSKESVSRLKDLPFLFPFTSLFAYTFAPAVKGVFYFSFVKIILLKSGNCVLTLRKRLFCAAKPMLLPCKTAAFGTQNNRFCNALMYSELHKDCVCEKYLHLCCFLFIHKIAWVQCKNLRRKKLYCFLIIGILSHNLFFL